MPPRRRSRRWIFILILLLLLVGGPVWYFGFARGQDTMAVTLSAVDRGDITSIVTATGKIQPQVEVSISSEVAGEIVELPVRDGQRVQRGDLLVRVNPSTLEAQAKQQEASLLASRATASQSEAEMLQAQQDLQRMQQLFDQGYATQEQLDQARTEFQVRQASLEAARFRVEQQQMQLQEAQDQLAKASLYAPIDGTVTAINAELGDRVVGTGQFEGTEIMRLANLENMEARVEVSESDIVHVKVGDRARIDVDALPNREFVGEVVEIANSAQSTEEGSQEEVTTFLVKVKLINQGEAVRPGMTATADIETATVRNVLRVPIQAVTVRPRETVRTALNPEGTPRPAATPAGGSPEDNAAAPGNNSRPGGPGGGRPGMGGGGQGPGGGGPGGGNAGSRAQELERVVFIFSEGTAQLRPVTTGIADRRFIEIQQGLSAEDRVISGPYRALSRELEHQARVVEEEPETRRP